MRPVYLDNAASTRPAAAVLAAMGEAAALYGNPSSGHSAGAAAARALEAAREELASALGGQPGEIVFTGSGTEANALAILGVAGRNRRRHLVAGALEHPAVRRNVERAATLDGGELTVVASDSLGIIRPQAVVDAVRPDTTLVCVMHVNNEIGTLQPVAEIAGALKAQAARAGTRRPHLHVDAVQSFGHVPLRVSSLGADSVALSAHKLHGPRGIGALWLRAGAHIEPLWDGGRQERGLRSGTENVPGAVGFACAARLAVDSLRRGDWTQVRALRDDFEDALAKTITGLRRTVGIDAPRTPHISSVCLPELPAEPLLHALGARGILASAGSACASKNRTESPVLRALGVGDGTAVLRFSLSCETTPEDLRAAAAALAASVDVIRSTPR